ncbi:hypothetical protein [Streptomyces niveus]|uniref:hypothetical protein n=1 Tax=Streptomyces niveus TaxID=193462 RepID=UPI0014954BBF|nr:hypothetical protein [Streptomyces niveus]
MAVAANSKHREAARDALLDAITEKVAEVKKDGGGVDFEVARLKKLAEAYALVVHGKD